MGGTADHLTGKPARAPAAPPLRLVTVERDVGCSCPDVGRRPGLPSSAPKTTLRAARPSSVCDPSRGNAGRSSAVTGRAVVIRRRTPAGSGTSGRTRVISRRHGRADRDGHGARPVLARYAVGLRRRPLQPAQARGGPRWRLTRRHARTAIADTGRLTGRPHCLATLSRRTTRTMRRRIIFTFSFLLQCIARRIRLTAPSFRTSRRRHWHAACSGTCGSDPASQAPHGHAVPRHPSKGAWRAGRQRDEYKGGAS